LKSSVSGGRPQRPSPGQRRGFSLDGRTPGRTMVKIIEEKAFKKASDISSFLKGLWEETHQREGIWQTQGLGVCWLFCKEKRVPKKFENE